MTALITTTAALLLALDPLDSHTSLSPERPHPMDISGAADDSPSDDGSRFGVDEISRPAAPVLLRFGADGSCGYFSAGDVDFDLNLRIGAQLLRTLGVYANLGGVAGFWMGSTSSTSASGSSVLLLHGGVLAEGDFGQFFIAAGPMVAYGAFGGGGESVSAQGGSQQASAASGWMPGFDTRVGLTFGNEGPSTRRTGFTVGLEVLGVFSSSASGQQSFNASGASQGVQTQTVFAATPMLFLGFETL